MEDAGIKQVPRRPGRLAAKANKQALNLRMDAGVIHRLKRHALDRGRTASDVVTELVTKLIEGETE
jgi:predicted DNA-binding protein